MPSQYRYRPLPDAKHIRLLHISKTPYAKTHFELQDVSLHDLPEFEAVSYTWGDGRRDQKIRHRTDGSFLYITTNCKAVLRQLAREGSRTLWIDAVCIDQDNLEERAQQVKLMNHVFQRARRTIAYIGESDKDTKSVSQWSTYWQSPQCRVRRGSMPRLEREFEMAAEKSAHALTSRRWFRRTWIIQEILLSKEVVVQAGEDKMDLPSLVPLTGPTGTIVDALYHFRPSAADYESHPSFEQVLLNVRKRSVTSDASSIDEKECLWGDKPGRVDSGLGSADLLSAEHLMNYGHLFDLLCETQCYGCLDPRDKLFALLSLFDGDVPDDLKIDYSRSIHEVYTNVTRYLLCYGVVKALGAARCLRGDLSLPSWVVDWRMDRPRSLLSVRKERGISWWNGNMCAAGYGDMPRAFHVKPLTPDCLSIRGFRVEQGARVERMLSKDAEMYFPAFGEERERLQEWMQRVCGGQWAGDDTWMEHNEVTAIRKDGEIGFVPVDAQSGDEICILLGFRIPFMLRPIKNGWLLVGECYLPWLMKGEAIANIDWENAFHEKPIDPLEDFDIY